MQLYRHNEEIVLLHQSAQWVARAPRDLVACAQAEEMRTAFQTQFVSNRVLFKEGAPIFPNGWKILAPFEEETRWAQAVTTLLDEFAVLSLEDRKHVDLENSWRNAVPLLVDPYEPETQFMARLFKGQDHV